MAIQYRMKEDWDARARENAMYYIDTRRDTWDLGTFYAEGMRDCTTLLQPSLHRLGFDPSGKRILEIGCGIGRLFPGFAEHFAEVWGIDVSTEMVRQGRASCPVKNANFILGTGRDLQPIPAESIDYCFSYIVFQHIPDIDVLWNYIDEIARVLRPGGAFQLHFRASIAWRSRLLLRLPRQIRAVLGLLRRQPLPGDASTWTGVAVSPEQVTLNLSTRGLREIEITPCLLFKHASFWAIGRK